MWEANRVAASVERFFGVDALLLPVGKKPRVYSPSHYTHTHTHTHTQSNAFATGEET